MLTPAPFRKYKSAVIHDLTYFKDNSARVAQDRQLLFTPFSSLEWDVYAESGDKLDLLSVGEFQTTIRFGRPL